MKISYINIIPVLLGLLVTAYMVPKTYVKATREPSTSINPVYSDVSKEFLELHRGPYLFEGYTEDGTLLSEEDAYRQLPFAYARNLYNQGDFPLTIEGKTYEHPQQLRRAPTFNMNPRLVADKESNMHFIFDYKPREGVFTTPSDLMVERDNKVIFIDIISATIDEEKTTLVNNELTKAGVVFPLKSRVINSSALKSFDEGILFVDNKNELYQMYIVDSIPHVRSFNHTFKDEEVLTMTLSENNLRELYGLITTDKNVYLNTYQKGVVPLNIDYDREVNSFSLMGTELSRSMTMNTLNSDKIEPKKAIAMDLDYNIIREYTTKILPEQVTRKENLANGLAMLTPLTVSQYSGVLPYIILKVKYTTSIAFALLGGLIGIVLFIALQFGKQFYKGKVKISEAIAHSKLELIIILLFGIPASILLFAFGPIIKRTPY